MEKISPFSPPVIMGEIFCPVLEPMMTFTKWVKINSTEYFCNAEVDELGENFCTAKIFSCKVLSIH